MKKSIFLIGVVFFLGVSTIFADTVLRPLFLTITQPNAQNPIILNPRGDILYPDRSTFEMWAIAQPKTEAEIFGWSIISGTDGSTDAERAITNFSAEKTASGIKFSWTPRSIFDATKIFEKTPGTYAFDPKNGAKYEQISETCEDLKSPSSPGGDSIPTTVDCFFSKKPSLTATSAGDLATPFVLFDQIVDPFNFSDRISLPEDATITGGNVEIDKNLINSTVFKPNFCTPAADSGFSVGWIYRDGPYPQTTPDGFYEIDPFWKPRSNAVYASIVTSCNNSSFFADSLYCHLPFYDTNGHEFISGEQGLFCSNLEGSLLFGCFHQCSQNYHAGGACETLEPCIKQCQSLHLSEDNKTAADGIKIIRQISPKINPAGEKIPQFFQIKNTGSEKISGTITDDFFDLASADIAEIADTAFKVFVEGSATNQVYCSRYGVQKIQCDFTLEGGDSAEVTFYLEGRATGTKFGKGKRKTEYKGIMLTTDFEVIDPEEDRITAKIFSDRPARIFAFEEEPKITAEIINKTGKDIDSITLDFAFDAQCLNLSLLPNEENKLKCGNPLGGKMRCSVNAVDNSTLKIPLAFTTKKKICENTEISMSAKSRQFSVMKTTEKITIQAQVSGIRSILNDDWSNAEYWYFDPHFGDSSKTPELSLLPLPDSWENHIIKDSSFRPNVKNQGYFGHYLFQYANYLECSAEDGGWAYGFMPIKEKFILVDGFNQYEIYGLPPEDYAKNQGVTRENGQLLAILNDPSASKVEIPFSDPSGWHFAIFEVRENSNIRLPQKITESILSKKISGFPAVVGHLTSSALEVAFDESGTPETVPSPQKTQLEFFEEAGGYTLPAIRADENGQIKITGIPKDRTNRYSGIHFLSGTYFSTDTKFSENSESTSLQTGRSAAGFFSGNFSAKPNFSFFPKENIFGTVFDEWTKRVVPNATLKLTGKQRIADALNPIFSLTKSNADGFFSFLFEPGKEYRLRVFLVGNRTDTFSIPDVCSNDPPYTDVFCAGSPDFSLSENSTTLKNLPVLPNLRGKINNSNGDIFRVFLADSSGNYVSDSFSVPSGEVSFFVPAGNYQILQILDTHDKKKDFSGGGSLISPTAVGSSFFLSFTP